VVRGACEAGDEQLEEVGEYDTVLGHGSSDLLERRRDDGLRELHTRLYGDAASFSREDALVGILSSTSSSSDDGATPSARGNRAGIVDGGVAVLHGGDESACWSWMNGGSDWQ
jgi:hypothetical protein